MLEETEVNSLENLLKKDNTYPPDCAIAEKELEMLFVTSDTTLNDL
jgi:hypothetical protein